MIDLRSDTVTKPTKAMREAMYNAVVGDDVYGDDPSVNELEEYAAQLIGKEAALFVPSGTFGNQLALLTHCQRGDEVLLGDDCHIVQHEVGAASVIAGVQLRTLASNKGVLDPEDIRSKIREEELHYPRTGLICLENAHSIGRVIPLNNMASIKAIADEREVPVHMDGARLFNAATYLQVDVREITQHCDTVMFCLSKGLCAPVGSILAGSQSFINRARKNRKLMGGALRQAGVIAAAGLVALKDMRSCLKDDHDHALYMGKQLAELEGVTVFMEDIHINMVFFKIEKSVDYDALITYFSDADIAINGHEHGIMRFVTNYGITKADVDTAVTTLQDFLKEHFQ